MLEAKAKLRMAAWLDETSSLPHHYLANVYYLTDRRDLALFHQRKAVELAPGNELYQQNLAALENTIAGTTNGSSFDSRLGLGE